MRIANAIKHIAKTHRIRSTGDIEFTFIYYAFILCNVYNIYTHIYNSYITYNIYISKYYAYNYIFVDVCK